MDWTPSQREAINHSGENILLSAAAGSGKTAVLVQRVIEKILDKENPVSVNELLILTYTEAAAAEMKRKISDAVNQEFLKDTKNEHLRKQRILINSADISTIHAFCLNVIKGNIHKTDIPVNFSIISDIENNMLKEKAIDLVLSRFYEKFDRIPPFQRLVLGYGSDKNDSNLRKLLLDILNFVYGLSRPVKWLNEAAKAYKIEKFEDSVWQARLFDYGETLAERIAALYDEITRLADSALPADSKYTAAYFRERERILSALSCIKERCFEKAKAAVSEVYFESPNQVIKDPEMKNARKICSSLRDLAKKKWGELRELFSADSESVEGQLKELEPIIRTFKNIVLMVMRAHKQLKRKQDYLDFDDLEHELMALLENKDGSPTATAKALQNKYKEILVDECQDSSEIQNTIFELISKENRNVFMVGDIKQSIYKFRNAVPELFEKKYKQYEMKSGGRLIRLSKNFRSRENIIDFVNFVFEKVMIKELGGVGYGEEERLLFGADYKPPETPEKYVTEFNAVDCKGLKTEDAVRAEAINIAMRIKKMVGERELDITDLKSGETHPVKYSDIVILMRNTKANAPIFEEVFEKFGVPLYSEIGRSYLTSVEIQTVLSFLQIIDNPNQDIPLVAVMRSPMWRFTPDMLAKIRKEKRSGNFYEAVSFAAENGNASCARFISELERLRDEREYSSVSELIMIILNRYNYSEIAAGMSDGAARQENLRLLFERAAEFDETRSGTLSDFMLYIKTILDSGKDLTPAKLTGENSDTVRIMTIHKSKGLEFPVVILADVFKEFNTRDTSARIIWHNELGFGFKYIDTDKRIVFPSIPHRIISGTAKEELITEEMRLLYVALTRAKEKLIISASMRNDLCIYLAQDKCLPIGILSAGSIGYWIAYAFARHEEMEKLADRLKVSYLAQDRNDLIRISLTDSNELEEKMESGINEEAAESCGKVDEELMDKLSNRRLYSEGRHLPLKLSVSEAKRRQAEEAYSPHIFTVPTVSVSGAELISATERGTITHFVLQHIDINKADTRLGVDEEIDRMVSEGVISSAQSEAVDRKSVLGFFRSDLGQRLKKAKRRWKEFNFYSETDAADFYPEYKGRGEKILLQGTMDCFFEENNGNLVLIDYKTDRISESEIGARSRMYLPQLRYYKKGLENISGRKVNEAYIYFLACEKAVDIQEAENEAD